MSGIRTWGDSDRGQEGSHTSYVKRAQYGQRAFEFGFLGAKEHGRDDANSHRILVSLVSTGQIMRSSHLKGQPWVKAMKEEENPT